MERRIAEQLALCHKRCVEGAVVVAHHLVYQRQLLVACLQYHQSALAFSAGSSSHLTHHHKSMLVGTEVGIVHHRVGIEYSHHTHLVEIQSLANHLRTNKYVCASGGKVGYYPFIGIPCTGGVKVHSRHRCLGECLTHKVLNFLCAVATAPQMRVLTAGTFRRYGIGVAAVVAGELVGSFVQCEAHVAVLTPRHPSALFALKHRGKAAAVLEQYCLLAALQCLAYLIY